LNSGDADGAVADLADEGRGPQGRGLQQRGYGADLVS